MDETYFRVGNEQYAIKHQTFGLTTLRSKHIKIHGDTVIFDFIGKSGQHQHKKITSRSIAVTLKKLDELPGYELFRYYDANETLQNLTSQDINDCIKVVMGHEFTAKDFRTWGGTLLACSELAKMKWDDDANERKKAVTACIKKVAIKLGNTPAVTKSSYIDPRVFELYDRPNVLSKIYKTKHDKNKQLQYCTDDEFRVLKALSYRGHLS